MNLLALTTSTPEWSVWLHRRDGWNQAVRVQGGRGTGQRASLTRMVWDLLAAAEMTPADLECIACDVGPGSFTGLRQGLALAQALAWAHDIPTRGLSSLDVMRSALPGRSMALPDVAVTLPDVVVALPARADVDYVAWREEAAALTAADLPAWWQARQPRALAIAPADVDRALACHARSMGAAIVTVVPDAEDLGRLALATPDARSSLAPRYLAVSEAEAHAGIAMPDIAVPARAMELPARP